jgi:predicted enzyme related to lactoylglutathione lyase
VSSQRSLSVVLDCSAPEKLAQFWAPALGYNDAGWEHEPYVILIGESLERPLLILQRVPEPKSGKNRLHIDLYADDIEAEATRLEGLAARRLKQEPYDEHDARWIVMADPEGNEFCVCAGLS